ncbi:MAG: ATP-binding protein [Desulforhabdus sp.]|jgi:signal transduction histidine kinase|nr:ATP-binding protein [Desulforhabdus sp.]
MNSPKEKTVSSSQIHARQRFGLPLAVVLISLLIALLFFVNGMVNLDKTEQLLIDSLKEKALFVIELLERDAETRYLQPLLFEGGSSATDTLLPDEEDALGVQEAIATDLVELAYSIGRLESGQTLTQELIERVALAEGVESIALIDKKGGVKYQSGPVSSGIVMHAKPVADGRRTVMIHLGRIDSPDTTGFVIVANQNGDGAVLLTLDVSGLRYRAFRAALQKAADSFDWGEDIIYLSVRDPRGRMLAQSGRLPDEIQLTDWPAVERLEKANPVSHQMNVAGAQVLELFYPFKAPPEAGANGTARIGINLEKTAQMLNRNKSYVVLWTSATIALGLIAMGLLYGLQQRNYARLHKMRERLHQADRLAAMGKLGAGVAHEIRNPLNAIGLAVQKLARMHDSAAIEPGQEFERMIEVIRSEILRLDAIIREFLDVTRSGRLNRTRSSLIELLKKIETLIAEEARERGVQIELRYEESLPTMYMDAAKIEQALLNLIKNSMEAIAQRGTISITAGAIGRNRVAVRLEDSGAGILPEYLDRIFDPYFTSKENGVGLGLPIAHEIIRAHGGEMRVRSRPGEGSVFDILLPMDNRQE